VLFSVLPVFTVARGARAQAADPRAAAAQLESCRRSAQEGREVDAKGAADRAEALFGRLASAQGTTVAGLIGMARIRSECLIPFAPLLRQGALVEESNELLARALTLDPASLEGRFILAMNLFRTPEFLGQASDAAREFETVLAQHGQREDDPMVRLAYTYLGDLYVRARRHADAVRVWRRGVEVFPQDTALAGRLARIGGGDVTAPITVGAPGAGAGTAGASGTFASRYTLPPIVVDVGSFAIAEPRSATRLSRLDVYTVPGGTADVLQVFQTMPGVTRATDGSDLYVRGGDPTETPVFVMGLACSIRERSKRWTAASSVCWIRPCCGGCTFPAGAFPPAGETPCQACSTSRPRVAPPGRAGGPAPTSPRSAARCAFRSQRDPVHGAALPQRTPPRCCGCRTGSTSLKHRPAPSRAWPAWSLNRRTDLRSAPRHWLSRTGRK
jgi:hypothetical protein